ncbi:hypothetical protein ADUPG1_003108, partial [Aduncisulcus paluster]
IIPQNITRHIRAFADDIIVLGTNPTNLENRLKEVSEALEKGALIVNPLKCFAIGSETVRLGKTLLEIGNTPDHKYLGISIIVSDPMRTTCEERVKKIVEEIKR